MSAQISPRSARRSGQSCGGTSRALLSYQSPQFARSRVRPSEPSSAIARAAGLRKTNCPSASQITTMSPRWSNAASKSCRRSSMGSAAERFAGAEALRDRPPPDGDILHPVCSVRSSSASPLPQGRRPHESAPDYRAIPRIELPARRRVGRRDQRAPLPVGATRCCNPRWYSRRRVVYESSRIQCLTGIGNHGCTPRGQGRSSMNRQFAESSGSDSAYDLIGGRYELINELGRGGFGSVYRALDRLTGRVLTIKRMRLERGGDSGSLEMRRALAQEFKLLASLRHPNVITVLDYGFGEDGEPYLVMDLEEHAMTILEAGTGEPVAVQADLLVQTLRALLYLHRVGIIHRDLKPENVLVVRGQVKVLDFGLSVRRGEESAEDRELAGTPGYIAPEVLRGEGPSEQSDLYALGVIAYELFVGQLPLPSHNLLAPSTTLPRPTDPVPPALRPVLEKLLHPDVRGRYADAARVIAEFSQALGWPLSVETVATRESLLQAAPLVGREREIDTLYGALGAAADARGTTWLVAGESGVGKSRLLDELRTRGLVDRFVVLRGQAVAQGGSPYHPWRLIVSNLLLWTAVSAADAEVLKQIVPDIARLGKIPVGHPPQLDLEATQTRLMLTVEALFRQQDRPVLVMLEDMHWAGSESLKLLAWLAQPTAPMQALFVASFRDDEAPALNETIPGARVLELERLDPEASSALAETMIGPRSEE